MKRYEITRSTSGQVGVLVHHIENRVRNATLLKHCVLHSPTGFEIGYGGSGPADLAVSILADFFGAEPERVRSVWTKALGLLSDNPAHDAIRLHQLFKRDFIQNTILAAGDSYFINGDEIAEWVSEARKEIRR